MNNLIFHIDVNSAYLSWEAVYRLQHGAETDLRNIPSIVGGDEKSRHGIVLAKSIPAKKYNIQTGESLMSARAKCKNLVSVPPNYFIYMKSSNAMNEILERYTDKIQRFSVDESFLDFTHMQNLYDDYYNLAYEIKETIKNELGFTINIGISSNKLLAKMAGDFKKPDMIHTCFPNEIANKMWPLPIEDLYMVGRATSKKLRDININTIGDLANYDKELIKIKLKSHGELVWNYANGIESSNVRPLNYGSAKGIGNSCTIPYDVTTEKDAYLFLLSLTENTTMRLRNINKFATIVAVSIRTSNFIDTSHQTKLEIPTSSTKKIYEIACKLFNELWQGDKIRHIGVRLTGLCENIYYQQSLFDNYDYYKDNKLNITIDELRLKYGKNIIKRACFLNSGIRNMSGGIGEDEYVQMTSIL